ncbi:hypothetical protein LCGC14_3078340, partial [marine sediment metagenome]
MATAGTLHDYKWIGPDVVELKMSCGTLVALTDDLRVRCYGSINTTNAEYTYWTAIQNENSDYSTPYVNGSRAVTHPDETFEMQSQFTIDMIVKPWFTYDISTARIFAVWYIDDTHRLIIYYAVGGDYISVYYVDGGDA